MEFCYLVRHSVLDEDDIDEIKHAIVCFLQGCVIFQQEGVYFHGISLSCQHSLVHYPFLIAEFGAPNGLCSSVTKLKHIKAVKKPWHHSNHHKALTQMLLTNQCLDKLAASHVDFQSCGMLNGLLLPQDVTNLALDDDDDDGGPIISRDILGEVTLAKEPSA